MRSTKMGTAMSMGLETENDLSRSQKQRSSTKARTLTIQELGTSLKTAIDLTESNAPPAWRECVSCREVRAQSNVVKTQCSHFYCTQCLVQLFSYALRDESLFPPRCCQKPIPISEQMLGSTLAQKAKEKAIELEDPDRTYCFDPKCSRYLPPSPTRSGVCRCQTCGKSTCRKCKKRAHQGLCVHECDALLKDLAQCKGWARCSQCRRLIELWSGCYHMRCLCDYEFCYHCTKRWKTCDCPYAEEANLYDHGV